MIITSQLHERLANCRGELEAMPGEASAYRNVRICGMAIHDEVVIGCHRVETDNAPQDLAGDAGEEQLGRFDDVCSLLIPSGAIGSVGGRGIPPRMICDFQSIRIKHGESVDLSERLIGDETGESIRGEKSRVLDLQPPQGLPQDVDGQAEVLKDDRRPPA